MPWSSAAGECEHGAPQLQPDGGERQMVPAGKGRERKRGRPGQGTAAGESGRPAPWPGGLRRLRVRVTLASCSSAPRFSGANAPRSV